MRSIAAIWCMSAMRYLRALHGWRCVLDPSASVGFSLLSLARCTGVRNPCWQDNSSPVHATQNELLSSNYTSLPPGPNPSPRGAAVDTFRDVRSAAAVRPRLLLSSLDLRRRESYAAPHRVPGAPAGCARTALGDLRSAECGRLHPAVHHHLDVTRVSVSDSRRGVEHGTCVRPCVAR